MLVSPVLQKPKRLTSSIEISRDQNHKLVNTVLQVRKENRIQSNNKKVTDSEVKDLILSVNEGFSKKT